MSSTKWAIQQQVEYATGVEKLRVNRNFKFRRSVREAPLVETTKVVSTDIYDEKFDSRNKLDLFSDVVDDSTKPRVTFGGLKPLLEEVLSDTDVALDSDDEILMAKRRLKATQLHHFETRITKEERDNWNNVEAKIDDPLIPTWMNNSNLDIAGVKKMRAREFFDQSLAKLPEESKDLLITRKGAVRDEADIKAIKSSIKAARRIKREKFLADQKVRRMKRTSTLVKERLDKSNKEELTDHLFNEKFVPSVVKNVSVTRRQNILDNRRVQKAHNQEIRKAFVASRAAKKARKLKNRAIRYSVITEALDDDKEMLPNDFLHNETASLPDPDLIKSDDFEFRGSTIREYAALKRKACEDFIKKIESEKNLSSESSKLKDWIGVPVTFIEAVRDYLQKQAGVALKCIDYFVNLCTYLWQLLQVRSYGEFYASTTMYLHSIGVTNVVSRSVIGGVMTLAASFILPTDMVSDDISTESLSEELSKITNWTEIIVHSSLSKAFQTIVLAAASFKLFSKEFAMTIYTYLGKPAKCSVVELCESVLKSVIRIVEVAELVWSGVPLSEALFSDNPLESHKKDAKRWLAFSDTLYVGLPVEGRQSQVEFMLHARRILSFFDKILPTLRPKDREQVLELHTRLTLKRNEVMVNMNGVRRQAPMAIVLHGDPGIGKSNLLSFLTKVHCDVMGREYSDRYCYPRTVTSDYWEGYDPLSQPYIHYSEIGAITEQIAKSQGDPLIGELTSIIDAAAFSCNMAFAQKGTVFAQPELVLIDTNCAGMNLNVLFKNPAAFERRLLYIEPVVQSKYAKDVGVGIDKKKAATSDDPFELWTFVVKRKHATGIATSVDQILADGVDIHGLYDLLKVMMTEHMFYEKSLLVKIDEALLHGKYGKDRCDKQVEPVNIRLASDCKFNVKTLMNDHTPQEILDLASMHVPKLDNNVVLNEILFRQHELMYPQLNNVSANLFVNANNYEHDLALAEYQHAELHALDELVTEAGLIDSKNLNSIDVWENMSPSALAVERKLRISQAISDNIEHHAKKQSKTFVLAKSIMSDWRNEQLGAFFKWLYMLYVLHCPNLSFVTTVLMSGIWVCFFGFGSLLCGVCGAYVFFADKVSQDTPYIVKTAVKQGPHMFLVIITYWLGWTMWIPSVLFGMQRLIGGVIAVNTVRVFFTDIWDEIDSYCHFNRDRIYYLVGYSDSEFKPYTSPKGYVGRNNLLKLLSFVVASGGLAVGSMALYRKCVKKSSLKTQSQSKFLVDVPENEMIHDYEKMMHCGDAQIRNNSTVMDAWNVIQTKHASTVKELDACDFNRAKLTNIRRVRTITSVAERGTHLFGLCKNFALINTHAFAGCDDAELKVSMTGYVNDATDAFAVSHVTKNDYRHLGNDMTVVRLSSLNFKDVMNHLPKDKIWPSFADAYIGTDKVSAVFHDAPLTAKDKYVGTTVVTSSFKYSWDKHAAGMCGVPLFVQKDSGYVFAGLHYAGHDVNNTGYAALLDKKSISDAIDDIERSSNLMPIHTQSDNVKFSCEMPGIKSPFVHESFHGINYFGKLVGPVLMQKDSKLKKSFLVKENNLLHLFSNQLGYVPDVQYAPPVMKPVIRNGEYLSPWNYALRKLGKQKGALDKDILERVISELESHICEPLEKKGIKWHPMTMEDAINGAVQDKFLRRINASTSGGFGWKGKKSLYVPIVHTNGSAIVREPVADLKRELLDMMSRYHKGEACNAVYSASLKDEPRELKKVLLGKTRVFWMSPLGVLILSRMFLSPFYTCEVENSELFSTCVGIDMHKDADALFKELVAFSRKIMEGDYENFDQSMLFDIGWAACSVISKVSKRMGYNCDAMKVLNGVLTDSLFPYGEMNKDLFCSPGQQPSGKYGTAEDNGLRGLILFMYFFYWMLKNCSDLFPKDVYDDLMTGKTTFFDYVLIKTYGDDVLASVKECVAHFMNGEVYGKFCKEHYGMGFTTASKSDDVQEFVPIDKMTFLKRTFKFHPELNRVVAPLAMDSIYRALSWYLPSQFQNEQDQMMATINSEMRELFFHTDKCKWILLREEFARLYAENFALNMQDVLHVMPTYQTVFVSLSSNETICPENSDGSGGRHCEDFECQLSDNQISTEGLDATLESSYQNLIRRTNLRLNFIERLDCTHDLNKRSSINQLTELGNLYASLCDAKSLVETQKNQLGFNSFGSTPSEMRRSSSYVYSSQYKQKVEEYIALNSRLESITYTMRHIEQLRLKKLKLISTQSSNLTMESSEISGPVSASVEVHHETVIDTAGTENDDALAGFNQGSWQLHQTPMEIRKFFERPINVISTAITLNTDFDYVVDPWSAFLNDPSVRAKLRNYAFARFDLKARIQISGTQWHYGMIQVSYVPQHLTNDVYGYYLVNLVALRQPLLKYLSATPGSKTIDVTDNAPLEISMPYFASQPMIRLFNESSSILAAGTEYREGHNLGELNIRTLNQVKAISATATDVYMDVYVWAENFILGCPTATVIEITTEADERKTGPVQKVASRASAVAGAVASVPGIGPYAKASAMALRSLERFAELFGWSYPVMNNMPERMKPEGFQNEANLIGYDTGKRITIDPEQEISVDPRLCAVVEDELALGYLNSLPALFSTFGWDATEGPDSTLIWTSIVTPTAVEGYPLGGETWLQPSPMAFAAQPFQYWRGKIIYRFQIVCSKFHKGKLAIFYEPNIAQAVLNTATLQPNKKHVVIIDLEQTRDFSICVDWAFPKAWARIAYIVDAVQANNSFADLGDLYWCSNGLIGVTPWTKLQSPDGSSVSVNVYISGQDMMYNQATNATLPLIMVPGLGDEKDISTEASFIESKDDPVQSQDTCFVINPTGATTDRISEFHFGEMPVSFRALLKRFATTSFMILGGSPGPITAEYPIFPVLYPSTTRNIPTGMLPTLMNYLRPAYVAMKGGLRKRFRCLNAYGGVTGHIKVHLKVIKDTTDAAIAVYSAANNTGLQYLDGTITCVTSVNGGVEFEIPFYTNNLYGFSQTDDLFDQTLDARMEPVATRNYVVEIDNTSLSTTYMLYEETAAAEDFTFVRFVAPPPFTLV